jgi:hypothetical protein
MDAVLLANNRRDEFSATRAKENACSAAVYSLFCSFWAWPHWGLFAGGFSAATKRRRCGF